MASAREPHPSEKGVYFHRALFGLQEAISEPVGTAQGMLAGLQTNACAMPSADLVEKMSFCAVKATLQAYLHLLANAQDHEQSQGSSERFSTLMTPSNATRAIAFAGNALRKHGTKPLQ